MLTNPAVKKKDLYYKLTGFLRHSIFIAFYVLSLQLIFATINNCSMNPLLLVLLLLGIAALSWWKIHWSLYCLLMAIPLVNGLHLLQFIPPLSLFSSIFASIYLLWLPRRLLFTQQNILPRTEVGHLVDILSGIVILSLIVSYLPYPLDSILYQFWHNPFEAYDQLSSSTQGANVLLQGLFFFRIMELEINHRSKWCKLISVFYFQVPIIVFFLVLQMIYRVPALSLGYGFYAPLDDIHSFGSYIAVLFFIFLAIVYGGHLKQKLFTGPFLALILLFVILSYSRATWLAVMVVSTVFLINKLSLRKKVLVISSILLALLAFNLFPNILIKSNQNYLSRLGHVLVLKGQQSDYLRVVLWKRALNIISDFPITGSGIGTFWKISPLYQDFSVSDFKDYYENAHNYFLQFGSDLGLPALLIFLSILFFTDKAGFRVSSQVPEFAPFVKGLLFGLSAYLITCLTGHPLLLSNQQFLFWFVISMIVTPYAFASHRGGDRTGNLSRDTSRFMVVLTMMVLAGYALEYGPGFWRVSNEERKYEYGFYPYEAWNGKKVRWTGEKAFSRLEVAGSLMSFNVYALSYDIHPKGLNFKLFVNRKLFDEINFYKNETRNLRYYLPYKKGEYIEIKVVVSKTFIPLRLGLSQDARKLGLAMSEIKFGDEIPKEGVGFYAMEAWQGIYIEGWPAHRPFKVRWTGLQASINIKDNYKDGMTLFLIAPHQDVAELPVRLNILTNGTLLREIVFTENQWKKVYLDQNMLKAKDVLTFQVNKTFNPKLLGLSEDNRDLGVAVAVLQDE